MTFILSGMKVYTENKILNDAEIVIEENKISAISESPISHAEKVSFPSNYSLVPGFIDLHVHGARGADVMDGSLEALDVISKALLEEGTTSFLATTMTADVLQIEKVLETANTFSKQAILGANCLGVHLEGPFISHEKIGAQNTKHILNPDVELIKKWQAISDNLIKLVTLAPELSQAQTLINFLVNEDIIASIGHTNASYEETQQAIKAGCQHATHIFNAMSGMQQRAPGAVTAALLAENVFAEMIVDGVHLHPAIVELIVKLKGADKLLLVTDSMRAKCLCDGNYELGGQKVHVKSNEARLDNGVLAGSVLKMTDAIKNVMKFSGCDLQAASKMASENPARALNIFSSKGSIAIGKDADLVVLDDKYNLVMTICRGVVVKDMLSTQSSTLA